MKLERSLFSKACAEATGVFALVFIGCGTVMVAERFPGSIPSMTVPAVFGLIVAAMIYALGHISGAHFNPAVTAAFAVARHFPAREVLFYWLGQFLGAVAAMGLLVFLLPEGQGFAATIPEISPWKALVFESVLTFFLMFVIVAMATDTRAIGSLAGAAIGVTVAVCAAMAGPVTGASMNPARSFAPALFAGRLDVFWIYFFGPMIGAIAAALFYEKIRCDTGAKKPKGCC